MGNEEPSSFGSRRSLEVLGETAASAEPGKCAFDNPASGQKLEAFDTLGPLDNLDSPWTTVGERLEELFAAVDPVGKDVAQPREFHSYFLQQRHGAVAILDIGRMNVNPEKKTIGIGHNMPFAAVNAFPGVVAARSAGLRSRRALAVDYRCRRLRLASELFSRAPDQNTDNPLPPARIAPSIKITLYRRVGRKLLRQCPPLAARRQNIENRLYNTTQISFTRPATPVRSRQKALDQRPLSIGHIAC